MPANTAVLPANAAMPANTVLLPVNAAMPAKIVMPMLLTSCKTEMLML